MAINSDQDRLYDAAQQEVLADKELRDATRRKVKTALLSVECGTNVERHITLQGAIKAIIDLAETDIARQMLLEDFDYYMDATPPKAAGPLWAGPKT